VNIGHHWYIRVTPTRLDEIILGISPSQIPRKVSEILDYRSDTGICCRSKISAGCIELGLLVSICLEASNTLEPIFRAIINSMRIHETDGGYVSSATGSP
jgi:hypothetical protein